MFEAPLHPKLVHIPIALSVLMPLISVGLVVAWFQDWLPSRAWWAAVALQAILFGGAWLAMNTGEEDEEKVEKVVAEEAIHEHEERAEQFWWGTGGVLALMVLPMVVPGARRKRWLAVAGAAGTVAVFWLGVRVGDAGGDLVYEHGAAQAHVHQSAPRGPTTPGDGEGDEAEEGEDQEH